MKKPIRIVAISDSHREHETLGALPPGDILVHCGDISTFGHLGEIQTFAAWLPPAVMCELQTEDHSGCCSGHSGFKNLCTEVDMVQYNSLGHLMCSDGTPSASCVR